MSVQRPPADATKLLADLDVSVRFDCKDVQATSRFFGETSTASSSSLSIISIASKACGAAFPFPFPLPDTGLDRVSLSAGGGGGGMSLLSSSLSLAVVSSDSRRRGPVCDIEEALGGNLSKLSVG